MFGRTAPSGSGWLVSARMDVLVFSAATAALALHVAVDWFVAPEPGTAASDHLLPGAASLAVLAIAAVVYPRLPAGGRAAAAVVLGALALEGAALAVADARAVGAEGEDWTGFLLCPFGVLLVGSAITLLWRSRKAGRLRYLRRAGITVAAMLAAYWLVVPVAIAILATHRPRADVAPADLGRAYEELTIRTSDGLDLAAWYVPSLNGAAVISYPTRQGKLPQARMLVRHGYGVLLLDARGYDGSEGDPNLFGWAGARDIDAGVAGCRDGPTSRAAGSGGSASRSAARCCSRPRPPTQVSAPSSRRVRASARSAKTSSAALAAGSRSPNPQRNSGGRPLERHASATLADGSRPAHLAASAPSCLCGSRWRRRGTEPRLLPCRPGPERALDDPRGKPRGWLPCTSACYEKRVTRFFDRALLGPGRQN